MWSFKNPVRIHFGADSFDCVSELIAGRDYAVVTYGEPYFAGLIVLSFACCRAAQDLRRVSG